MFVKKLVEKASSSKKVTDEHDLSISFFELEMHRLLRISAKLHSPLI